VGLPGAIQLTAGLLIIRCSDMEDLLRRLVLLATATGRALIEAPVPRRSPASEAKAANRELSQLA